MTDNYDRFVKAATAVAVYPPRKKGQYVSSAQVYWPLIEELREALGGIGINWKAFKR